ncbi:MAG: energy transducer TonB [Bacteroidota bacterium]
MSKSSNEKHLIKKPYYPGGMAAMRQLIKENLRYPEKALAAKVEGSVLVRYTIDHKGNVIASKIISSLGYGCDEEAMRLVQLLKFKTNKIRKVRSQFHKQLRIHFKLPQEKPTTTSSIQYHYTTPSPKTKGTEQPKGGSSYTIQIKW